MMTVSSGGYEIVATGTVVAFDEQSDITFH